MIKIPPTPDFQLNKLTFIQPYTFILPYTFIRRSRVYSHSSLHCVIKDCLTHWYQSKGQLISKANSTLFIWTKKNEQFFFRFLPWRLDTFQYFLIAEHMQPRMHILENKHFFTKSCHRQTYQNSKISCQKICSNLLNKVL